MQRLKARLGVLLWLPLAAMAVPEAAAQVDTQLAGNALPSYPYFEYVRALDATAPLQLALDPTRFPSVVGQTCDLYVVNDKTAAQWASTPALTDVTPGGFLTVTFTLPPPGTNGGTPVGSNTFTLANPGDLASSAGTTNLGRPYDVVADCNRNGTLDAADFIDGRNPDQGGIYVVHDLTQPGSLAVTAVNYDVAAGSVTAGFESERTYYPSGIAGMGQLPLIIISHGNGHNYTWYDYLQSHLASYGYIVMSHENNTGPGIQQCSLTTLQHTDAIIGQQAAIAGGVLNGHIDTTRIVWIGHSRGGEGVARAFDRITDIPPSYTPVNFNAAAIRAIVSIAPTDFLGQTDSNPHAANYHLMYGGADGDVHGGPSSDIADSFNVYERATGFRSLHYFHGVGHNEFNCCGFADATGPDLIGRPATQVIARAYFLAVVKRYLENNVPAKDYLWRQYEHFRPQGAMATAVLDLELKEPPSTGKFVIDDYQSQPSLTVSSSGGTVDFNVTNLVEGVLNDGDGQLTWTGSDPMNGMTRGAASDTTAGAVFDAEVNGSFIEWSIVAGQRNLTTKSYVSLRACQGTRHPLTITELADRDWMVYLRDGAGHLSGISVGSAGGGIEEPYQRTGQGTGTGWSNEFETIRLRLTDFLANGTGLDLANVTAVRFESSSGRLCLDDLELTTDP
jgi:chlorophyllase-like protein